MFTQNTFLLSGMASMTKSRFPIFSRTPRGCVNWSEYWFIWLIKYQANLLWRWPSSGKWNIRNEIRYLRSAPQQSNTKRSENTFTISFCSFNAPSYTFSCPKVPFQRSMSALYSLNTAFLNSEMEVSGNTLTLPSTVSPSGPMSLTKISFH